MAKSVICVDCSNFPYASQLALRPAPQEVMIRRVTNAANMNVVLVFMVFVLLLLRLTEYIRQSYNF